MKYFFFRFIITRDAKGFRPKMEIELPVDIFAGNFTDPCSWACFIRWDIIYNSFLTIVFLKKIVHKPLICVRIGPVRDDFYICIHVPADQIAIRY